MGTQVVRDVTGKLYDMDVLRQLYNLYEQYKDIRETNYLQDFSMLETVGTFNPKYIIRDMVIIYLHSVINISNQPDLLHKLIFIFHEEGKGVCNFEFSNNMMLSSDITTLCFLYHISYKRESDQCETVQILKSLILNKYEISIERRTDDAELTQKQNKITLLDIAFSFPSVTWDISCNLGLWTKFFDQFSDFDLPKVIFTPKIFLLLPQLKERLPLAILLVIVLRTSEYIGVETYERLSLRTICNNISLSYEYKIFPERLKLELCKKWQIVMEEESIYKYNPCFAAYHQKAKDIIAKIKPDDPDLEFILSGI